MIFRAVLLLAPLGLSLVCGSIFSAESLILIETVPLTDKQGQELATLEQGRRVSPEVIANGRVRVTAEKTGWIPLDSTVPSGVAGIEPLNRKLQEAPRDSFLRELRGSAYLFKGDYTRAIQDFNVAIESDPKNYRAWNNRAQCWWSLGDLAMAEKDFRAAAKIEPEIASIHFSLASLEYLRGANAAAKSSLDKAIRYDPNFADAYTNRGQLLDTMGDRSEAIRDFTKALTLRPDYWHVHYRRGMSYHTVGALVPALADADKALEANPKHAPTYTLRGLIWNDMGHFDKAIQDHNRAVQLTPGSADAYGNRGLTYWQAGKISEAVNDLSKSLELEPSVLRHHLRGSCYYTLGEYPKAIADFQAATKLNPGFMLSYSSLALVQMLEHDPDCLETAQKVVASQGRNPEALFNMAILGYLYARYFEDDAKAAYFVEKAEALFRDSEVPPLLRHVRGQVSTEQLREDMKDRPETLPFLHFYQGLLLVIDGKPEEAKPYFRKAMESGSPKGPDYLLAKAELARLRDNQ